MATFGWMIRLARWYTRKPKLVGFSALAVLIVGLAVASVVTGFTHGFWPNLLLNAAGDMLGGMVILLMIEPIVSRAAVQIRQHPHLDFRLFAQRIPLADREILVLDTYSGLFDAVNGPRAAAYLRDAARRGVKIKILLMSPATDASRLREAQLATANPGLQIDALLHDNIALLSRLENELRAGDESADGESDYSAGPARGSGETAETGQYVVVPGYAQAVDEDSLGEQLPLLSAPAVPSAATALGADATNAANPPIPVQRTEVPAVAATVATPVAAGNFELRLYAAAAPFTLYARDETLLFALLPAYQQAHDAPQLEISRGSQTGSQITETFNELWREARPVSRLAPIRLSDDADARPMLVRNVIVNANSYYVSNRIDAALEARPDQHFWPGLSGGEESEAEVVPPGSALGDQLEFAYRRKYGRVLPPAGPRFVLMRPARHGAVPKDRTVEFDRLPLGQILGWLAEARRSVRILDTSSILIGQDGDEAEAQAFVAAALAALGNGATVRILLLAPTTSAALERAQEIRDPRFNLKVERNIERLRFLGAQLPGHGIEPERLQVRLYDQLPVISVHQIDDRVMAGFLPYRRRSSLTSQYESQRHSDLGEFAVDQFQRLWDRARPLSGLRYLTVWTSPTLPGTRLLIRAWRVRRVWYVASERVEDLMAQAQRTGAAGSGQQVRAAIEEVVQSVFRLSDPVDEATHREVWDEFARIYSSSDPGVPVRALLADVI
ncbi:hypothetical protein KDL01_29940 [Actinospica durhamensis]|uniref:DUF5919 domain-containing protein n=1 Tax=Actinospica durhamensis TaxID=1508375 RepID=A0A941IUI4_9ACTN|nr:DUF5919 domain-containing protein [Actinospica durhamensis]MBR7837538.1 hypothetical protein [Actinospica durhamensis]